MSDSPIIVIDNGSHTIKGGSAGTFEPQCTFPTKVTRFPLTKNHTGMHAGNDIIRSPKGSSISKVLDDQDKIDWNGLEKLYKHLLYEKLLIDQQQKHKPIQQKYKFFLTQSPFTSNKTRAKMCQMLFESFNCDGLYFGITSTLSLYAHGLTTGVVIDSGYKNTFITPIFEGYMLPLFAKKLNYGGLTLDTFLMSLLNSKHPKYNITINEAEKIKIDLAYTAMDFFDEETIAASNKNTYRRAASTNSASSGPVRYALPDGKTIKMIDVNAERFQCTELMFQPNLYDIVKDEESLPYSIHQAITRSDHSLHKTLFKSIVLNGGNTMIHGIKERISKDVTHLAPASVKVNIHASPQRKYATYTGASLMASHSEMDDIWITPELYKEMGASSLTIRCF